MNNDAKRTWCLLLAFPVASLYGYDFKVVVTNKTLSPKKVLAFHEGRGSQKGIAAT